MSEKLRIIVADDETLIRTYFQEVFSDLGHEVVAAAENGRQLVDLCVQHRPDLVVTDIKMPEMDGLDAAIEIMDRAPAPIILVSAYHDDDLLQRAQASHIMAYLVKPIEKSDLAAAIRIAVNQFARIQSLQQEAADLRTTLEDRKLEKAKGVLMQLTGLTEQEAHRRMQRISCDENIKLIEVARRILSAQPAADLLTKRRP